MREEVQHELGRRKQVTSKTKEAADSHTPGQEREADLFGANESRMAGVLV